MAVVPPFAAVLLALLVLLLVFSAVLEKELLSLIASRRCRVPRPGNRCFVRWSFRSNLDPALAVGVSS